MLSTEGRTGWEDLSLYRQEGEMRLATLWEPSLRPLGSCLSSLQRPPVSSCHRSWRFVPIPEHQPDPPSAPPLPHSQSWKSILVKCHSEGGRSVTNLPRLFRTFLVLKLKVLCPRNPSDLGKSKQLVTLGSKKLRGSCFSEGWEPLRKPSANSDTL